MERSKKASAQTGRANDDLHGKRESNPDRSGQRSNSTRTRRETRESKPVRAPRDNHRAK